MSLDSYDCEEQLLCQQYEVLDKSCKVAFLAALPAFCKGFKVVSYLIVVPNVAHSCCVRGENTTMPCYFTVPKVAQ